MRNFRPAATKRFASHLLESVQDWRAHVALRLRIPCLHGRTHSIFQVKLRVAGRIRKDDSIYRAHGGRHWSLETIFGDLQVIVGTLFAVAAVLVLPAPERRSYDRW